MDGKEEWIGYRKDHVKDVGTNYQVEETEDTVQWLGNKNGLFTVKATRKILTSSLAISCKEDGVL